MSSRDLEIIKDLIRLIIESLSKDQQDNILDKSSIYRKELEQFLGIYASTEYKDKIEPPNFRVVSTCYNCKFIVFAEMGCDDDYCSKFEKVIHPECEVCDDFEGS